MRYYDGGRGLGWGRAGELQGTHSKQVAWYEEEQYGSRRLKAARGRMAGTPTRENGQKQARLVSDDSGAQPVSSEALRALPFFSKTINSRGIRLNQSSFNIYAFLPCLHIYFVYVLPYFFHHF